MESGKAAFEQKSAKADKFELFRREMRSIDIMTYDEFLERAQFIARD